MKIVQVDMQCPATSELNDVTNVTTCPEAQYNQTVQRVLGKT